MKKADDSSMLNTVFAFVSIDIDGKPIYLNHSCNSSHGIRPVRFAYEREKPDTSAAEVERLKAEIEALEHYIHENADLDGVQFEFKVYNVMNDSKVVEKYTKTPSTWACRVCHLTMKNAWQFDTIDFFVPGSLELGI